MIHFVYSYYNSYVFWDFHVTVLLATPFDACYAGYHAPNQQHIRNIPYVNHRLLNAYCCRRFSGH